jgi:broad specificity phosphatase PhoE
MGECYLDVVQRVEPVILWLERQEDTRVIIVGHQAINRVISGYLLGHYVQAIPALNFPLNYISRYLEQNSQFEHNGILFEGADFFRKQTINLIALEPQN